MRPFTREDLRSLLGHHETPCVSLYVPTVRGPAGAGENALRFKNALGEAKRAASPGSKDATAEAFRRLHELEASLPWGEQRSTLAVFVSPTYMAYYRLAEEAPRAVVVADSFLTKPLVKYLQGEIRYYVLAVAKENVTLFEGGRDHLDPVNVPGMPRGLRDLDKPDATRRDQGLGARHSGGGTLYYGAGAEGDGKEDLRVLFRAVDRALHAFTHDEKTPLVLATFDHYGPIFHEASKNPALLDDGIRGDPAALTRDQLRERALALLRPRREAALKAVAEEYAVALNAKRATNYLPNIAKAAVQGRVKALLVEDGRTMPGTLDRSTGDVAKGSAGGADLLDDVGELVLGAGGHVYVLPRDDMPTDVGVAAIYRY